MKTFLMAVAVLACVSTLALAGPNAGGTLVTNDAHLLMSGTNGSLSVCGQGVVPSTCEAINTEIDGATAADPAVFKVYAAFPQGSAPRLLGLTWGVTYGPDLVIGSWGMCGNFELNDPTWPASGSGSSVTYDVIQTGLLTAVYWFAGYNYGTAPQLFQTGGNPGQGGGYFGDDTVPAILDPIAGYGAMGFDGPGIQGCPPAIEYGACCDPCTAACTITQPADCAGNFLGGGTVCDPNPCPPPPNGACCAADGTCTFVAQCLCTGNYLGDGVPCEPDNPCALTGACCAVDGNCTITTEANCAGVYQGDNTGCEPSPCIGPNPVQTTSWGSIKNLYK